MRCGPRARRTGRARHRQRTRRWRRPGGQLSDLAVGAKRRAEVGYLPTDIGRPGAALVDELDVQPDDIEISRMHGMTPFGGTELDASQLLAEQPSGHCRVSLFLAILEMARNQQLRILQAQEFATIWLTPPLVA